MGDVIVVDGDMFDVEASFADATANGKLKKAMSASTGGGKVKIKGQAVCVEGDETSSIVLTGLTYTTSAFADVPGTGIVQNAVLASDQVSKHVSVNGKKIILKGSKFKVSFQGASPAQKLPPSSPPVPDPAVATPRSGQGELKATESKVTAK